MFELSRQLDDSRSPGQTEHISYFYATLSLVRNSGQWQESIMCIVVLSGGADVYITSVCFSFPPEELFILFSALESFL